MAGELKAQVAASDAAVTELQGRLAAAEAAAAVSAGEVSEARQDLEVVTAERESRDWELLELRTQVGRAVVHPLMPGLTCAGGCYLQELHTQVATCRLACHLSTCV